MNLNKLRDEAYRMACEHGFHDKEYNNAHWLMLVVSEISEAVEADRKGKHAEIYMFRHWYYNWRYSETDDEQWKRRFERFVKDTVEDEIADAVIRLLDISGVKDVDLSNVEKGELYSDTFIEQCFEVCETICLARYEGVPFTATITDSIAKLFFLAERKGINLIKHIELKMKYNSMREYKHGKKY